MDNPEYGSGVDDISGIDERVATASMAVEGEGVG
jgi:hypothetical protein